MIIKATREELFQALAMVNKRYDNNVIWNAFEQLNGNGTRFRVTIRVKSSHGKGASVRNGRHNISACWHVHGDFFDVLFSLNPEITIQSLGKTITKEHGNWEDFNIGSIMYPLYASEACKCYITQDVSFDDYNDLCSDCSKHDRCHRNGSIDYEKVAECKAELQKVTA